MGARSNKSEGRAARLARLAGHGMGEASFESLEQRQLLFSLTVQPDSVNPATGLGTATATFGYVIPYLFKVQPAPDAGMPMTVIEEFADEMAFWTMVNPPVPPNGTIFEQSQIQISYQSQANDAVRLLFPTTPGVPDFGAAGAMDRDLALVLEGTDRVTLTFRDGAMQGDQGTPRLTTNARFTIRAGQSQAGVFASDGDGLKTDADGTRVELLLEGQVVRTFTGAELAGLGGPNGEGVFTVTHAAGFDSVRFSAANQNNTAGYADTFVIDDISSTFPSTRFAAFVTDRIFGARVTFAGPAGATAQFLDLYGGEIRNTLALGVPQGGQGNPLVDRNGDAIPDFNDGIGRIIITNANANSAITIVGGEINQEFVFTLASDVAGMLNDFEQAGFGYATTNTDPPMVIGLPPVGGSVLIGSPFVRNRASPGAYLGSPNGGDNASFLRSNQGIFVPGGSFGSVSVHGIVHGSSAFAGSLGRYNTGVQMGSVSVTGDLGEFMVMSDAGYWEADNSASSSRVGALLTVGRGIREIGAGGRLAMNVQVLADINNASRPAVGFINHNEREVAYAINVGVQNGERVTLQRTLNATDQWNTRTFGLGQASFFGTDYFRNDALLSAEFVGYNGTAVVISGNLGARDPVNTAEDITDVFAFAADPSREVVIQGVAALIAGYVRIVDRNGVPVAAFDVGAAGRGQGNSAGTSSVLRFRPDRTDVFYIVLNSRPRGGEAVDESYQLTVSGMAPTTIGAVRSGAGVGQIFQAEAAEGNLDLVLTLNAGSLGSLRVGTAFVTGGGMLATPDAVINSNRNNDDLLSFGSSTISIPTNLYNVTLGGDMEGTTLLVGRDLGTLVTGMSPVAGTSNQDGDITSANIRVGRRIGTIDINGGLGVDQDPDADFRGGVVSIRSGSNGGNGNIGQILVGAYISGESVSVTTSPGSTIDQFMVLDGPATQFPGTGYIVDGIPLITMGIGSDVRFVDLGLLQRAGDADLRITLVYGQSYRFVDDAGASFTVQIAGGAGPGRFLSTMDVRSLPIDGSQGVAVGRINANLFGNADLIITGDTGGTVSIGRIQAAVDGDSTGSRLIITGSETEIDIGRIDAAGAGLASISNTSRSPQTNGLGDIVAIDTVRLNTLTIDGNLGRTQTNGAGPMLLGPTFGLVARGGGNALGAPLQVDAAAVDQDRPGAEGGDWDTAQILVPIVVNDYMFPSPLEDVGSPIDGQLNGIVVRQGDLQDVRVGGAVGDVILQNGHLINLIANADGIRPFGAFEGIVGSLYADVIVNVDVGDGLVGAGGSPFAQAGIFANDEIIRVTATRVPNASIRGIILAANVDGLPRTQVGTQAPPINIPGVGPGGLAGLGTVEVLNGLFDNAFIQSVALDDFWSSFRVRDQGFLTGDILLIEGRNTDLFRSEIQAISIDTIRLTGGSVYDSTTINVIENIQLVTADAYLNSTSLGEIEELHGNSITSSDNVGSIVTNNLAVGDISDLTIDVIGTLTGRIAANNLVRLSLNVDNVTNELFATTDAKALSLVSGRVRTFTVGRHIRAASLEIAGPVETLTAGGEMTGLRILSSGPDGRIGTIRATGRIEAEISSSGPITTIESVNSDISGRITTTDSDGSIGTLRAGRDLLLDAMILSNAQAITAGRNIGRAEDLNDRALDVRGNLGSVTAQGQIFSDILVGQNITGTISSGRAVSKPGNDRVGGGDIVAFGSIAALTFMGDFDGNISSLSGGIGTITILEGSFRQGRLIKALDGSIGTIRIVGGDLLGDIFTDGSIGRIELLTGVNGFRGQIGIASNRSNAESVDSFRNQLPPETIKTVGIDGPSIVAGHDITSIFLQSGSIWETTIRAGRTIGDITINGGGFHNDNLTDGAGSFVTAGDRIVKVVATGKSDNVAFIAGLIGLGDDDAVGGAFGAADVVKEGSISQISLGGNRNDNITISAGLNAGADGVYNTSDDKRALGRSSIAGVSINGARTSSVWADGPVSATGGSGLSIKRNGSGLGAADASLYSNRTSGSVEVNNGVVFNFTTPNNQRGSIFFTGAGRVFYDRSLNRIILVNTNSSTSVTVQGKKGNNNNSNSNLKDISILGNNNISLGSLRVNARLQGLARVFVDGGIGTLAFNRVNTSGMLGSGGDIGGFTANIWDAGRALGRAVASFIVNGAFGKVEPRGEAAAEFLDLGVLRVGGRLAGTVSSDRDIDSVTLSTIEAGGIRSGGSIGPITAQSFNGAAISAKDAIASIAVTGDVRDSTIYAGADLGRDAAFGGTGLNEDTVSNGTLGPVTIGGSFPESDIAAGVYRGPDGFLGTADDRASDGRSVIGDVTIAGQDIGSNINSEQFRVISTGAVGRVLVGGSVTDFRGNFAVRELGALPVPVVVTDVNVFEDSRVYRAEFSFNQPIDASTFAAALSILELRNSGATTIGLAQGSTADYTVRYNASTNIGTVIFSRNVTDRNLPQQPGVPGPGLFRFVLSGGIFRGASQGVLLDGNGDGTTGDDFSVDALVGDAGDKLVNGNPTGQPGIDFYLPIDLNLLLDSNYNSDNNPDINSSADIRGTIGDHPDANSDVFRSGGDVDLYRISLRAGQILRLGQMRGVAQGATRAVFDALGNQLASNSPIGPDGGFDGALIRLPNAFSEDGTATSEDQYLVMTTGTYIIGIAGDFADVDIADVNNIPNNTPSGGAIGAYQFSVQVFDDGNTGFAGDTDSGDGTAVVNAPLPIQFAGSDGAFGTSDDVSNFTTGRFGFTLNRGPDGAPNTFDDSVSGSDGGEVVSTRSAGADRVWGTSDDVVRSVIASAIGLPGGVGVPSEVAPDADVFRLNNGQPIAPGTRVRITFRLTDTGGNIGLAPAEVARGIDAILTPSTGTTGNVQIALFETPSGTGFSDAKLVASPSEFVPIGGQAPATNTDGTNSYGYDSNGDFFMEVVVPGALGVNTVNVPASYAVYVQGAVRSDYTLEILTQGTGSVQRSTQNVLLETNGGLINWLETSGLTTQLEAFTTSVLGFAGQINGVDVDEYVITALVDALNDIFTAANVAITVSADAAAFEGQDFSTVYLAGNTEPNAFFNNGTYGASEHVDMLNIDKNDQAVVFLTSLAVLGNDPSQAGVDNLVRSLTAAVGRRIGELIGLRITNPEGGGPGAVAIMASNSVDANPGAGGVYGFTDINSTLSGLFDGDINTNFFLGTQNSLQLIQRIVAPRA